MLRRGRIRGTAARPEGGSAWGPCGTFENDGALDWLGDLIARPDASSMPEALDAALAGDDEYGPEALAAAEIVAALIGRPSPALPEDAAAWVAGKPAPPAEVVEKARRAVAKVLAESELRELWAEAAPDDFAGWKACGQDLLERLGGGGARARTAGFTVNGIDLFGLLAFLPGFLIGVLLGQNLRGGFDYWVPLCLGTVPGLLGALLVGRTRPCTIVHVPVWILMPSMCAASIAYIVADRGLAHLLSTKTGYILAGSIVSTVLLRLLANPFPVKDEFPSRHAAPPPVPTAPVAPAPDEDEEDEGDR